jgi:hypothetical protein
MERLGQDDRIVARVLKHEIFTFWVTSLPHVSDHAPLPGFMVSIRAMVSNAFTGDYAGELLQKACWFRVAS